MHQTTSAFLATIYVKAKKWDVFICLEINSDVKRLKFCTDMVSALNSIVCVDSDNKDILILKNYKLSTYMILLCHKM